MNPKSRKRTKNNRRAAKRTFKDVMNRGFKKKMTKQQIIMDAFTPEGIPVTSPLDIGMNESCC
ncbi:MAG: hypothetical protein ABIL22_08540 [candidate division WOR-3 bacterium]